MNTTQFGVAVIGAGIVGASCAFHLAQRGLKVVVLEAFASHAEGSTGLSFASIRGQWAHTSDDTARAAVDGLAGRLGL